MSRHRKGPSLDEPEDAGDFPLELVAGIAARLLRKDDYETAARRALELLKECDYRREVDREERISRESTERWEEAQKRRETVPRDKALREITGGETTADALRRYREIRRKVLAAPKLDLRSSVSARLSNRPQPVPIFLSREEIEAKIVSELETMQLSGLSRSKIDEMREAYLETFPRRRAKPRKKRLESPLVQKVLNNTLDVRSWDAG